MTQTLTTPRPPKKSTRRPSQSLGTSARRLLRDTRGVTMVEYTILLCLVTVIGSAAVASLGMPMVALFRYMQMMIVIPVP